MNNSSLIGLCEIGNSPKHEMIHNMTPSRGWLLGWKLWHPVTKLLGKECSKQHVQNWSWHSLCRPLSKYAKSISIYSIVWPTDPLWLFRDLWIALVFGVYQPVSKSPAQSRDNSMQGAQLRGSVTQHRLLTRTLTSEMTVFLFQWHERNHFFLWSPYTLLGSDWFICMYPNQKIYWTPSAVCSCGLWWTKPTCPTKRY